MKITERQRLLINKLDQVIYRKKTSGELGYFFGREECTTTINSLITKGLIESSADSKNLRFRGVLPNSQ